MPAVLTSEETAALAVRRVSEVRAKCSSWETEQKAGTAELDLYLGADGKLQCAVEAQEHCSWWWTSARWWPWCDASYWDAPAEFKNKTSQLCWQKLVATESPYLSLRDKKDFGEMLGVPRLHALKAEWRKRQVFVHDKATEPADTEKCKHFSVSPVCLDGWYLGDSCPAATHKQPQSWPF